MELKTIRRLFILVNLILKARNLELEEVCGKRIVNVMVIYLKVCSCMVNEMDMVDMSSKMETTTSGNLKKIITKE